MYAININWTISKKTCKSSTDFLLKRSDLDPVQSRSELAKKFRTHNNRDILLVEKRDIVC
jgi:hypothetical protein